MNPYELNNKVFKIIQISSQESLLLKSIDKFYENLDVNSYDDFIQILNSQNKNNVKTKISIRLIDYFVTKYSKK
jgi:predicted N-acyltransferase